MKFVPQFGLANGQQQNDRIVYPLIHQAGWLVQTVQATGTKEDLILSKFQGDSLRYEYILDLGSSLEPRIEKDGSVGVYGSQLFSGDVTTATDADAALLEKARKNATKDQLLFVIPKPYIIDSSKKISSSSVKYELEGKTLTLVASNLSQHTYPILSLIHI